MNIARMTINFDTITNNYEVIYVIKTMMNYYLFADVIHDAIWFMNIHEQNNP